MVQCVQRLQCEHCARCKKGLKHAYTSIKLVCDCSVMKISKKTFSHIAYSSLSSNHVILIRQQLKIC